MDKYIISILSTCQADDGVSAVKQFTEALFRDDEDGSHSRTQVAVVFPDSKPDENKQQIWTEVASVEDISKLDISYQQEESVNRNFAALSDCLHHLSDTLPSQGAYVEILWLVDSELPSVEESLEMFGAMKRLTSWYNARLTIATPHELHVPTVNQWAEFLSANVVSCDEDGRLAVCPGHYEWRGYLEVPSEKDGETERLYGFSLESCQPSPRLVRISGLPLLPSSRSKIRSMIVSDKIELLAAVDWRTLPHYLLTPHRYRLVLDPDRSPSSSCFLNHIKQDPYVCYLTRLRYGSEVNKVTEDAHLFTDINKTQVKSYSQLVTENIKYARENPFHCELVGDVGYLYFAVAAVTDLNADHQDDSDLSSVSCQAFLLNNYRDLDLASCYSQLSKEIHHQCHLHQHSLIHEENVSQRTEKEKNFQQSDNSLTRRPSGDNNARSSASNQRPEVHCGKSQGKGQSSERSVCCCGDIEELLRGLKQLNRETLCELERQVEQLQATVIEAYISEFEEPLLSDVILLLGAAHNSVYRNFLTNSTHDQSDKSLCRPVISRSDWDSDATTQLERKALVLRFSEAALDHYQSHENLAGLSPPPKGKFIALEAGEFLKFFKSDGTAAKNNLSLVKLKKNVTRCLPGCDITAPSLGDCSQYHDVYYNQGTQAEAIQKRSDKLLAHLSHIETSTTCIIEQAHSPASMPVSRDNADDSPASHGSSKKSPTSMSAPRESTDINPASLAMSRNNGIKAEKQRASVKRKMTSDENVRSKRLKRTEEVKTAGDVNSSNTASRRLYAAKKAAARDNQESAITTKARSRSERHKQKLEEVIIASLAAAEVKRGDVCFKNCAERLYTITKSFVKDLTSSRNLREEMRKIADMHVTQVVSFERERQNSLKKAKKQ